MLGVHFVLFSSKQVISETSDFTFILIQHQIFFHPFFFLHQRVENQILTAELFSAPICIFLHLHTIFYENLCTSL